MTGADPSISHHAATVLPGAETAASTRAEIVSTLFASMALGPPTQVDFEEPGPSRSSWSALTWTRLVLVAAHPTPKFRIDESARRKRRMCTRLWAGARVAGW